ncbi:glycosyl transferase group 1 [Dethiosulfovibrio peptidovorans DSM 11002]|uniref:Glycosyl transferase group 1 n=1 Tax=Dethiosulfovibrio peptidovorans DSM 11002 TaxID=469381 RepID=D2Z5Q6_9BACT|nr:glycosyltransferase family 4 protein [Dethiosulfovibrio peptidovorans]EFC90803.1 glycosyl transferase group 1 [Dethiosulfovibrio peptidovorans DSM 11002]
MKILYLHQYFNTPNMSGGTRSYEMARRMVKKGHEVHIITSDRETTKETYGWRETSESGINVHWYPVPYNNEMSYVKRLKAFFLFSIASALKAVEIGGDVLFATSTPLTIALPGVYASKRLKIPMIFEVRDLWPEMPIAVGALKNPLLICIAKKLEIFAYKNSKYIVALSPGMRDGITNTGYPIEKVSVIPNSCDVQLFDVPKSTGKNLRKKTKWLNDRPLVVYIGTFGIINGVSYMVKIAEQMLKINPQICFVAIGSGKEKEQVISLSKKTGTYNKNMFILDPVQKTEIPQWLSACNLSLSLFTNTKAMWKNSANKFFDTLAAGRPIGINYGGWQNNLISKHRIGLALDPKNIKIAADQINKFILDTQRQKETSAESKQLGMALFDRDLLADKLISIIENQA